MMHGVVWSIRVVAIDIPEGEKELVCIYAKLLRTVDGDWKERGVGYVQVLEHETTKKQRLLMRRDKVWKMCANFYPELPQGELKSFPGMDRCYHFGTLCDCADYTPAPEHFCIRFKTQADADSFATAYQAALQANATAATATAGTTETETETEPTTAAATTATAAAAATDEKDDKEGKGEGEGDDEADAATDDAASDDVEAALAKVDVKTAAAATTTTTTTTAAEEGPAKADDDTNKEEEEQQQQQQEQGEKKASDGDTK